MQIRSHVGSRHDGVVDDDDDTTTMTTTEKFYRRRPTCPMTRWLCRCKSYRRRLSLSGASHMTATVILTCPSPLGIMVSRQARPMTRPVVYGVRSPGENGNAFHGLLRDAPSPIIPWPLCLERLGTEGSSQIPLQCTSPSLALPGSTSSSLTQSRPSSTGQNATGTTLLALGERMASLAIIE